MLSSLLLVASCQPGFAQAAKPKEVVVQACGQTSPVASAGDAADDPAIWIHPKDPDLSLILGTDKKRGLAAYDLDGKLKQFLELGAVNNVDLRQSLSLKSGLIDLAVLSHRHHRSVDVVEIRPDAKLEFLGRFPTQLPDVYGICMRKTDQGGAEALINSKIGRLDRYALEIREGSVKGELKQTWMFGSQIEACVVDDAASIVFVGEEKRGVWSLSLEAPMSEPRLILEVGQYLRADLEGLALVDHPKQGRLLIASSQGDHHFIVMQAKEPHQVLGRFRIGEHQGRRIDAVTDTDGIEVFGGALGSKFPGGLLVVQDGSPGGESNNQNFKLVCWDEVLRALELY